MPDASLIANEIAARLRVSLSLLNRQLRHELSVSGLSAAGLTTLARLRLHPDSTPSQLAAAAGVRVQSLTRLLADLERGGHIRRDVHATDRRQSMLGLTAKGAQVLRTEAKRRESALSKAIATHLSAVEHVQLLRAVDLLDRIGDALTFEHGSETGTPQRRATPKRQG